jgi:hypothetical protein
MALLVVGMAAGWIRSVLNSEKAQLAMIDAFNAEMAVACIQVRLVQEGEFFIVYNETNDQFIAQCSSIEQISGALRNKCPGKLFFL